MNGRIVRAVGGVTAASAVALLAVPMLASAHVVNQIDVSCTPTAYTGTADLGGSWGAGADVTQTLLVDRSVRKTAVVRVTSARQLTLSAPVGDVLEHLVTYRVTWAGNRALAEKRLTCRAPTPAPSPAPAPVAPHARAGAPRGPRSGPDGRRDAGRRRGPRSAGARAGPSPPAGVRTGPESSSWWRATIVSIGRSCSGSRAACGASRQRSRRPKPRPVRRATRSGIRRSLPSGPRSRGLRPFGARARMSRHARER